MWSKCQHNKRPSATCTNADIGPGISLITPDNHFGPGPKLVVNTVVPTGKALLTYHDVIFALMEPEALNSKCLVTRCPIMNAADV